MPYQINNFNVFSHRNHGNLNNNNQLYYLISVLDVLVISSAIIELLFYFEMRNIFGAVALIYGWLIIRTLNITAQSFAKTPVSFLMIFGLALFYYVLPMPLTIIDGRPVAFNMRMPYTTFIHHAIFATVISFTHAIYVEFLGGGNFLKNGLEKIKFYQQPSDVEIWVTALLGLFGGFYAYFIMGSWQMEASDRGIGYHFTSLMGQFIWMPIILLFPQFRGLAKGSNIPHAKYIVMYSVLVGVIAIASNWRTVLFSGVMIFIATALLGWLHGFYKISHYLNLKTIFGGALILYIVGGPFVDMAHAMVDVRGSRVDISATELLAETIRVYNGMRGSTVNKGEGVISEADLLSNYAWNEDYLSNIVLNRFVNLKISDNSLFYAEEIGEANSEMFAELGRQILAMMPSVMFRFFGLELDRKYDVAYSIGDYLYGLASNDARFLGSSVISSMPGVGMAMFGYWYILLLIPLFTIIFLMYDSLAIVNNNSFGAIYSYYFFTGIVGIVNYFNDRHVYVFELRFIIRGYWESITLFLIVMWIIRGALSLYGFRSKSSI